MLGANIKNLSFIPVAISEKIYLCNNLDVVTGSNLVGSKT